MMRNLLFIFLVLAGSQSFFIGSLGALNSNEQSHIELGMRLIGHELLYSLGDSTSRVLPIQRVGNSYRIPFENNIAFRPNESAAIIDSVMALTGIADSYRVELMHCETGEVAHSYQIGKTPSETMRPCGKRDQPAECYSLFITLLDTQLFPGMGEEVVLENEVGRATESNSAMAALPFLLGFLLLAGGIWAWRKRKTVEEEEEEATLPSHLIRIGAFVLNPYTMELTHGEESITLTNKESELLLLFNSSANSTIERDELLQKVWGDEGDYVGRTLDVFVSKLRKKLQADPNVKILNIRGIGYRMVVNG